MPWPKGKPCPEYVKKKISKAERGKKNHMWGKRGKLAPWWGRKHSLQTKKKLAERMSGSGNPMWGRPVSKVTRKKHSIATRGQKRSDETKARISAATKGVNNPMWGKHPIVPGTTIAASKRQETRHERLLKRSLRQLGIRYKSHYLVAKRYVADVYLPEYNLLLEADGEYYHGKASWFDPKKQRARDRAIRKAGFKLQRITNKRIEADPITAVSWALKKVGLKCRTIT